MARITLGILAWLLSCIEATSDEAVSLMQVHQKTARRHNFTANTDSWTASEGSWQKASAFQPGQPFKGATCEDLSNQGAYFTIPVHIGTPEQNFNLVADTGSDALIIPDCRCVTAGYCKDLNTCFTASKSTSFGLDVKKKTANSVAVMGAKMNYGSGQIQVLVATEKVRVAGVHANMQKGVFLMEDRRSLNVHGDFEGILGLGLPHEKKLSKEGIKIPSFMESSDASRYTLCFNEYPNPGTLHMGLDALPNPMRNIGKVHWGLDLHGLSTGTGDSERLFCAPHSKTLSQKTACGAIPDSGTTLMMGPQKHILKLYASLCEKWPRCLTSAQKSKKDKDKAFHDLLADCESWMTDADGVNEVPSVFLHLAGSEGNSQQIEMSAWAYIVETNQEIYKVVTTKIFGSLPIAAAVDTGNKKKICTASFGPQEYNTVQNGPVWIMGAPIFYAATVGYDIGDKEKGEPAAMGFIPGACKNCKGGTATPADAAAGPAPLPPTSSLLQKPARRLRHMHTLRDSGLDLSNVEHI